MGLHFRLSTVMDTYANGRCGWDQCWDWQWWWRCRWIRISTTRNASSESLLRFWSTIPAAVRHRNRTVAFCNWLQHKIEQPQTPVQKSARKMPRLHSLAARKRPASRRRKPESRGSWSSTVCTQTVVNRRMLGRLGSTPHWLQSSGPWKNAQLPTAQFLLLGV